MKQNITIEVPDGKVAKYNSQTQTIQFFDKVPARSKTWEEFCKKHPNIKEEYYITTSSYIKMYEYETSERPSDTKNNLASKEDAEGILALIQLTRLHDEWVGDWDPSIKKSYYAITYDLMRNNLMVGQWWDTIHLLSFPIKEMTEEFLECFRELIWKAKRFI